MLRTKNLEASVLSNSQVSLMMVQYRQSENITLETPCAGSAGKNRWILSTTLSSTWATNDISIEPTTGKAHFDSSVYTKGFPKK